jgi:hypothetical protein
MSEPRRFTMPDLIGFVLIVVLAAGARGGYLWFYADGGGNDGPLQVQDASPMLALDKPEAEQASLAGNIKESSSFEALAPFAYKEEPTAHVSPGYPWLLGYLNRFGVSDFLLRWVQCGLGSLTAGFYFLFARRALPGYWVAILTGLFCAGHPFWVINTAVINDGTLTAFLLGGCLWLGASGGQTGGPMTSLLYGLGLAVLALVRAAMLPFSFIAMFWFLLRCRRVPGGWMASFLAFLGFLGGLTPWTLRNFEKFSDIVPIVDSVPLHLFIGNNPDATGGPLSETTLLNAIAKVRGAEAPAVADQLAAQKQLERYLEFGKAAVSEVQQQPTKTVQRRINAGLYFFFGEDWFKQNQRLAQFTPPVKKDPPTDEAADAASKATDSAPFVTALPAVLFGMLLLGVLGWRWTYAWRWESGLAALAVMWVPIPYLLSHAEALTGPRQPLDGVFLCYAAFALGCLLPIRAGAYLRGNVPEAD